MPKFRSPYRDARVVPWLGPGRTVQPGEVVNIPDDLEANFVEAGWERVLPVKTTKQKEGD